MLPAIAIIAMVLGLTMLCVNFATRRQRKSVVVQTPAKLSEAECRAAFNVPDTNRLWIAVLQTIEDIQGEAKSAAETSVANHGICASCVGGGEFLTRLRDRMILERDAAIKQPVEQAK